MHFLLGFLVGATFAASAPEMSSDSLLSDRPSAPSADSLSPPKRAQFLVLPNAFYAPETRVGVGLAGQVLVRRRQESRPSSLFALLTVTQNRQAVVELQPEAYLDSSRLFAKLTYNRWPDVFYGVGDNLPEGRGEDYSAVVYAVHLEAQRRMGPALRAGLQFDLRFDRLFETTPYGQLETGLIPGSSSSRVAGPGFLVDLDTRDNIFSAYRGHWLRFSAVFLTHLVGSQFDAGKYTADLRWYRPLGSGLVGVVQAYGSFTSGTTPFQMLPQMGGLRLMRGLLSTRYRDYNMMLLQGEVRSPFVWRLGIVAFGGIGDVAHRLGDFALNDAKAAGGLGLRFRLNEAERLHVRLDYGFNLQEGGSKLYVTVNEAI